MQRRGITIYAGTVDASMWPFCHLRAAGVHQKIGAPALARSALAVFSGAFVGPQALFSIDGTNTWFVSKAACELGLRIAISELDRDELPGKHGALARTPRTPT